MATALYEPKDAKKAPVPAGSPAPRRRCGFRSEAIRELIEHETSRGCFGRTTWGMHISLESIEKGQFRRP